MKLPQLFPHKTGWLFQKVLYPSLTWRRDTLENSIYLTFDDGPVPDATDFVREELAKLGAKATFFCVGDNLRKHPTIARELLADGHFLANHTFNHIKGWNTPTVDYLENVARCESHLAQYGRNKKLFRPPYGRISNQQIKALQAEYEIIMWEVLTGDYAASLSPERCLQKSIAHTRPGSIVVFHDSYKAFRNLSFVLPRYLLHFAERGYCFKVL